MIVEKVKKFRKKPVVIEAVQFTKECRTHPPNRINLYMYFCKELKLHFKGDDLTKGTIKTLEGEMTVSIDDWIIKGIKGEFYPCKPDIFENSYEVVED